MVQQLVDLVLTFLAEVANSANKTRLIPFEFSTTQTYMLEFSNLKIRVYKDSSTVFEANKTITAITKANPAVVTANWSWLQQWR